MNEVGDRREAARRWDAAENQLISERERALVARAYALFDCFYDQLEEEHELMRKARMLRARKPDEQSRTAPTGNTLGSCVDNMIADQIDNLPEAVMLPEREETAQSAEEMDDVVSFVLYRAGWPGKYQTLMEDAIVAGTGVAQVFWDENLEEGEGMVNVLAWHPEDFYPDPMYEDIQDGRGCFKATHTSVAWVEEHYPQAKGYVAGDRYARADEDDAQTPEGDTRVTLLEFWYKKYDAQAKKTRVHMAQVAGRALLFSTETGYGAESEYPEGLYAHGEYPFVLYKYRDAWRKPFGTGLIYDYYDTQTAIDRYAKYIDDNARESSIQRHFIRRGERRESRRRGRHAQDDHRVGGQRHPRGDADGAGCADQRAGIRDDALYGRHDEAGLRTEPVHARRGRPERDGGHGHPLFAGGGRQDHALAQRTIQGRFQADDRADSLGAERIHGAGTQAADHRRVELGRRDARANHRAGRAGQARWCAAQTRVHGACAGAARKS